MLSGPITIHTACPKTAEALLFCSPCSYFNSLCMREIVNQILDIVTRNLCRRRYCVWLLLSFFSRLTSNEYNMISFAVFLESWIGMEIHFTPSVNCFFLMLMIINIWRCNFDIFLMVLLSSQLQIIFLTFQIAAFLMAGNSSFKVCQGFSTKDSFLPMILMIVLRIWILDAFLFAVFEPLTMSSDYYIYEHQLFKTAFHIIEFSISILFK